ncbi:acetyltransferase, GNAT family [Marvinbryantia formatexigens DSM 14469]|uniref:Acetyltransferase, GNAT family n=1 Tax=Marvinbryantia formatexigens DSM 14469 TaxID=478749 RepID=C6LBK2_9FIRM|nr:GNAT family N-acetyltransferase [Marvinbryantia formatexigens]EET61805.1 acetyltransferase, GNAT family [Marvinbryantia formatexigens DSM 14469]UWO25825.1 GNAT family N-acetyltransferase [Marvinbryantia formatexigens DSM 14469]SDF38845.1 Acetyltransferase (GNAT) family protein [Marvinbryantia formatexigens]
MIRKAVLDDIDLIEDTYNEHFKYEIEHEAYTVFKKGVYPTRADAERAINLKTMFVYEENRSIGGSIIIDKVQPTEYADIPWKGNFSKDEVMVIHLLMVRPSMSGKGIATLLIGYAVELAKTYNCKTLRLDTGSQNIPAVSLYKKNGFEIVASAPKKVGDVIAHKNHLYLERVL